MFLFTQLSATNAEKEATRLVGVLESLLPERTNDTTEAVGEMPVLAVEGQDMVALLEIPGCDLALPVGASWDARGTTAYPRCFSGSTYDRNLVVGGSDRQGQLECLDTIGLGATVTVTDMTGMVFTYAVVSIEQSKSADAEVLENDDYDLTLFVRDTYSLKYTLVRCIAK